MQIPCQAHLLRHLLRQSLCRDAKGFIPRLLQAALQDIPVVVRTSADRADNVRDRKQPLPGRFVPDRPDFPVIVEAKGEFLCHAVNPISTCRPSRQHRAYK